VRRSARRLRHAACSFAVVGVALGVLAPAAGATTAAQAIAYLNTQRAANGIPAGLVEDSARSGGCLAHESAYTPTASQSPHDEIPGQPGFSLAGQDAARSSDLSSSTSWSATQNPWTGAPIHLAQLFDPTAATTWYGEGRNGACMGTSSGDRGFYPGEGLFSLPGDGSKNVPSSESAGGEYPYAPAEAAGLTGTHGPTIILWAEGLPAAHIASATLVDASGQARAVRTADQTTPSPPSHLSTLSSAPTLGSYTDAAFAIAAAPLPVASYVLTVQWTGAGGATLAQVIHFSVAAGSAPDSSADSVPVPKAGTRDRLSVKLRVRRGRLSVRLTEPTTAARGHHATVRFRVRACSRCKTKVSHKSVKLRSSNVVAGPRIPRHGVARVTVTVPAFHSRGVAYRSTTLVATLHRG
jgi:hypothetical protein